MGLERWEAVKRAVLELGRARVRVGIVGDKATQPHGATGLTNAEIGIAHELGTPLSTIVLVTKEMQAGLPRDSALAEDVELLRQKPSWPCLLEQGQKL